MRQMVQRQHLELHHPLACINIYADPGLAVLQPVSSAIHGAPVGVAHERLTRSQDHGRLRRACPHDRPGRAPPHAYGRGLAGVARSTSLALMRLLLPLPLLTCRRSESTLALSQREPRV